MRILSFILIFLNLVSCQNIGRKPTALNDKAPIDLIFDLDWTLIKQVESSIEHSDKSKYATFEGEVYRIKEGASELLASVASRENVRISFFSGGGRERNTSVLKQIRVGDTNAYDLAHKVLSKSDLTVVSTKASLSFTERYKKDVRLINSDLSRVVLIDDDKRFLISNKYKRNILWLGKTYNQYENYYDLPKKRTVYDPKSYEQWFFDKHKLHMVREILDQALTEEDFLETMHNSRDKWDFEKNSFRGVQALNFINKTTDGNCQSVIQKFTLLK
ncbi:hypothetical protein A9Q84_15715 [Halobacteriovorax marinus]|uniref:FCP1 homology domain-containing protein n=1 Tax=Halobacteriovorax marinus TaxID=97084 RepID=A0A1Y5F3Z1_9BACT|nr:hypothetical protein A9Q84_15715 [Halobacteriovorax marinus]